MKKTILMALCITASSICTAQISAVRDALKKYNIDEAVLDPNIKENSEKYAFDFERTVTTTNSTKVYLGNFDPSKSGAARWTLVSVNGMRPGLLDNKAWNDEHSMVVHFKADENSYKIISDDGNMLQISYEYDESSLDSDHFFLKDCVFTLFINTKTGKLEKSTEINLKELRIKTVKASKLEGNSDYTYNAADKTILLQNEEITVTIKMLGLEVPMTTKSKYTYKK